MALTTVFFIKRLDVAQNGGELNRFLRMKCWVMKPGS
jgi:hypothetical protein